MDRGGRARRNRQHRAPNCEWPAPIGGFGRSPRMEGQPVVPLAQLGQFLAVAKADQRHVVRQHQSAQNATSDLDARQESGSSRVERQVAKKRLTDRALVVAASIEIAVAIGFGRIETTSAPVRVGKRRIELVRLERAVVNAGESGARGQFDDRGNARGAFRRLDVRHPINPAARSPLLPPGPTRRPARCRRGPRASHRAGRSATTTRRRPPKGRPPRSTSR